ncbi:hypothetical protein MMC10_009415 [Thelotrema lepadinum]|nr:hypothetical protein [Thelotrema lepadinum]
MRITTGVVVISKPEAIYELNRPALLPQDAVLKRNGKEPGLFRGKSAREGLRWNFFSL